MNRRRWSIGEQGRISIALGALLASAPLLARPGDDLDVATVLGWGFFALSLALGLWPQARPVSPSDRPRGEASDLGGNVTHNQRGAASSASDSRR
jgi:hypothetical protein